MNSWLPASVPLPQSTPYSYTNNAQQDLTKKLDHSHNNLNSHAASLQTYPPITAPQGALTVLSLPFEDTGFILHNTLPLLPHSLPAQSQVVIQLYPDPC